MSSPQGSASSLESGEWDEQESFCLDTLPTPFESFDPEQSFEGCSYAFTRSKGQDLLGQPDTKPIDIESRSGLSASYKIARTCFNCGEADHAYSACPYPKDRERIRRSRKELEEAKAGAGLDDSGATELNSHARLHEQIASVQQRLQWLELFEPGRPSVSLVEALTDAETAASYEANPARMPDLPYLRNMLTWGYPPGWISREDPLQQSRKRILQDTDWESTQMLNGFEVDALEGSNTEKAGTTVEKADTVAEEGGEERRWVDFRSNLFDSMRLQAFDTVYRRPLPGMQSAQEEHPWPSRREEDYTDPPKSERHALTDRASLWQHLLRQNGDEHRKSSSSSDTSAPPPPPPPGSPPPPLPSAASPSRVAESLYDHSSLKRKRSASCNSIV